MAMLDKLAPEEPPSLSLMVGGGEAPTILITIGTSHEHNRCTTKITHNFHFFQRIMNFFSR